VALLNEYNYVYGVTFICGCFEIELAYAFLLAGDNSNDLIC
jgi:hypothetical protein